MEKVCIDDVDRRMSAAADRRNLADPLGIEGFACNYFELGPDDSFAFGYHAHEDQEEVFYVQSGTATFETEDGPVEVSAGELVRFAPGEFQRGVNEGDERVIALALGAPRDGGDVELYRECTDCGERTRNRIELTDDRDALVTLCERCGGETGRFT